MKDYTNLCKNRFKKNESQNPDKTDFPFVRMSKDLKYVEIVVVGLGPVYRKKIGGRDPSIVKTEVEHYSKMYYQFGN